MQMRKVQRDHGYPRETYHTQNHMHGDHRHVNTNACNTRTRVSPIPIRTPCHPMHHPTPGTQGYSASLAHD